MYPLDPADLGVEQFEKAVVVLDQNLDEQVERSGGDDDVLNLGQGSHRVSSFHHIALDPYADHGLATETDLERNGEAPPLTEGVDKELLRDA